MSDIATPRAEIFYWVTVTFSQTLGTALGDWIADDSGLGYAGGALVFLGALSLVVILYFTTRLSRVALFWAAFILTRPLGATVGDFFDKPHDEGGLDISRPLLSLFLLVFIVVCVWLLPQRAGCTARRIVTDNPPMQTPNDTSALRRFLPWIVVAVVLIYACAFQGSRAIYSPDEGRYTDVAIGMLDNGDWMQPDGASGIRAHDQAAGHLLGDRRESRAARPFRIRRAAAERARAGRNDFPVAVDGQAHHAAATLAAGAVYATFAFPPLASNIVTTDTLLTFFETLQLAAFAAWYWPDSPMSERNARWLFWLGAALAFMTKGPPGLLVLLGCLVFTGMRWRLARGCARCCAGTVCSPSS